MSQITVERGNGKYTNTTTTLKVKLHSKTQALDALAKHLNLFRDTVVNNNLQVNVSISDLAKLVHAPETLPAPDDEPQLASGKMIDGWRHQALTSSTREGVGTPGSGSDVSLVGPQR